MEKTISNEALEKAIATFPTLKAFSEALGVKYQVVQQWLLNRVPSDYCPAIERITNRAITCEELRPDVDWPYLRNSPSSLRRRHTDVPA